MAGPAQAPGKSAPRKRAPAKKAAKPAAGMAGAPATPVPAGTAVDDGRSINQWLNDLRATPLRIEVFDQWWEFKLPTGGNALTWDNLLATEGIRAALASMMFDQTPTPERTFTDDQGAVHVLAGTPGTAAADRFLAVATDWVPPEAAEQFWARIERAIFGPGEASAS